MDEDLYELHLRGATLIIEHVGFHRSHDLDGWLRQEVHRVVGHAPEEWLLRCDGAGDHSDLKGPPGEDDRHCRLCCDHKTHTKALHARLLAQGRAAARIIEL